MTSGGRFICTSYQSLDSIRYFGSEYQSQISIAFAFYCNQANAIVGLYGDGLIIYITSDEDTGNQANTDFCMVRFEYIHFD